MYVFRGSLTGVVTDTSNIITYRLSIAVFAVTGEKLQARWTRLVCQIAATGEEWRISLDPQFRASTASACRFPSDCAIAVEAVLPPTRPAIQTGL